MWCRRVIRAHLSALTGYGRAAKRVKANPCRRRRHDAVATVKNHLARIHHKIGGRDRAHMVAIALRGGLLPADDHSQRQVPHSTLSRRGRLSEHYPAEEYLSTITACGDEPQ